MKLLHKNETGSVWYIRNYYHFWVWQSVFRQFCLLFLLFANFSTSCSRWLIRKECNGHRSDSKTVLFFYNNWFKHEDHACKWISIDRFDLIYDPWLTFYLSFEIIQKNENSFEILFHKRKLTQSFSSIRSTTNHELKYLNDFNLIFYFSFLNMIIANALLQ